MPGDDGHYKDFYTVFKTPTTEEYRPSKAESGPKRKSLAFRASVQHVRNTQVMLQCGEECSMWRLIYGKRKLKPPENLQLEQSLNDMSFSCGAQLQDADIPTHLLNVVFTGQLTCGDPVEKLYYAAKLCAPSLVLCVHAAFMCIPGHALCALCLGLVCAPQQALPLLCLHTCG